MAKYTLEIVMPKGNTFRDLDCTLTDARLTAVRQIMTRGKKSTYVNILKETYKYSKWGNNVIIERIDFDDYVDSWTCIQYGKQGNSPMSKSRKYRLSPKTGRVLNWDKYWKYI